MLASLLRIILLTATLKILERGLDKGPIIDDDRMIEFCREIKFKIAPQGKPISDSDKFSAIITPHSGTLNTVVKDDEEAEDLVKEYFDEAIYILLF